MLLSIWEKRRQHPAADISRQLDDVQRCIRVLHAGEDRWVPKQLYPSLGLKLNLMNFKMAFRG